MAKGDWWFKFEYLKWLTDEQLSRCSLETHGFWIRCICIMRKSGTAQISGTGSELCRILSVTPSELKRCFDELEKTKAADVTVRHASVTQKSAIFTLMSRKIRRELKVKEQNRLRKEKERRHAKVTDASRDRVISNKKEVRKEEEKNTLTSVPKDSTHTTEINPFPDPVWEYPMKPLVDAFPHLTVTPAMVGFIKAEVKPEDQLAWQSTIQTYRMNFNPETKSYLPEKTANLLSVFRAEREKLAKKTNGTITQTKSPPPPTEQELRERLANAAHKRPVKQITVDEP